MKLKNIFVSFIIAFIFWILLNNTLDPMILGIGALLSLGVSLIFCARCDVFSEIKLTPAALLYTFIYIIVFLYELIKSNLDVARRVITPSLPINPGIVEVKTRLRSKMGRMILANSITLTPGTLTIDIVEDTLYIHWIDVQTRDTREATEKIVRKFEKYLEKIYG
ncbi:MAG: Na+/H+ antiporter subunit E [Bacteroidales bacterium]|nr:Na+/H+ antiporter subunit E [Bacteroidales bacterium]MBS3775959.1 Na+/H+ antiporter subunit E [Bacteroidales bacterium]